MPDGNRADPVDHASAKEDGGFIEKRVVLAAISGELAALHREMMILQGTLSEAFDGRALDTSLSARLQQFDLATQIVENLGRVSALLADAPGDRIRRTALAQASTLADLRKRLLVEEGDPSSVDDNGPASDVMWL